ncbi:hypothetical protein [Haladaptatus sp.]|uniref:hypothetical protein n=1 Tax=Haladaptatus sp. TaxID=1973141 RepID=UPI003C5A19C8
MAKNLVATSSVIGTVSGGFIVGEPSPRISAVTRITLVVVVVAYSWWSAYQDSTSSDDI